MYTSSSLNFGFEFMTIKPSSNRARKSAMVSKSRAKQFSEISEELGDHVHDGWQILVTMHVAYRYEHVDGLLPVIVVLWRISLNAGQRNAPQDNREKAIIL